MTHRVSTPFLLTCLCLVCVSTGCEIMPASQVNERSLPPRSIYLLHLPGIGGDMPLDRWWVNALREAGAADGADLYDWTANDPGLGALQAYERNHREATNVAKVLSRRRRADPTGKVILTAESGGAGVAIWALERLPRGVIVDDVVLVAPALSPDYDLSSALAHVSGKMYYFSSDGDWFTLGVGTSVFGTMDGKRTNAAGFVGFHRPAGGNAGQYAKLVELRYTPDWMKWGDFGSHTGGLAVPFARHFIAPLLLRDEHAADATPAALPVARTE